MISKLNFWRILAVVSFSSCFVFDTILYFREKSKQKQVIVWTDKFANMAFPPTGTNIFPRYVPVDIGFVYPGTNVVWRFHTNEP